ncbi:ectonucleotide pyrophosphatase/phosphodiesterase family member 5-like protein, partial [Dinothrombium tinctorium]
DQLMPREKPQLVVLSFDGFRYDYINKYSTPNFDSIAENGVYAPLGYLSTFSTKTFSTHWTIATGLFEESHGIIDNTFYDPILNETFERGMNFQRFFGGEPIWVTAKKQAKRANIIHWPGSSVNFSGITPDFYFEKYSKEPTLEARLNKILKWIDDGVDLSMSYFYQPDLAGHKHGVFSKAVKEEVSKVDEILGNFLKELSKTNRRRNVNLIVLADHGMANVTGEKHTIIALKDYLNFDEEVEMVPQYGPVGSVLPKLGKLDIVYQKLKNAHPNMTVYLKPDIPERFHYRNNPRIMPIVAIADEGFVIQKDHRKPKKIGWHGYDNKYLSMHPIFFAQGPSFKTNYQVKPFDAVNLYSLFCNLLKINPAPNNGSLTSVQDMLKDRSFRLKFPLNFLPLQNAF